MSRGLPTKITLSAVLGFVASVSYGIDTPTLQRPTNLSFESVNAEGPLNWRLYDGDETTGGSIRVQSEHTIHGRMAVELTAGPTNSDPFFIQCLNGGLYEGRTISVSASVKLQMQNQKESATARVWIWQTPLLRQENSLTETTQGWLKVSATLATQGIPEQICYGGTLDGSNAKAWFDSLEITFQ